jgi:hypothetical protein
MANYVNSVFNINDLRNFPIPNIDQEQFVHVECHTNKYDGGGGFFYFTDYSGFNYPSDPINLPDNEDNNGTYIKSNYSSKGRWFRIIDGSINIRYFGIIGSDPNADCSVEIQKAINHASSGNLLLNGNTVYFPNGQYGVSETLLLKSGVSLIGESSDTTTFRALYSEKNQADYMIKMDKGRIQGCNIANITFEGNSVRNEDSKITGCMYFEAIEGFYGDGGMWGCTIKNINIYNFNGSGIIMIGGVGNNYKIPNQFCVFENIKVVRQRDEALSLFLTGEHGQLSFINCAFDAKLYDPRYDDDNVLISINAPKGKNVSLKGAGTIGLQPKVVSFINSTFQNSEYGVYIENSENITFDTCWFETLDLAITSTGNHNGPSRSINILNSSFANSAGFGSINVINRNTTYPGRCITSENSEINVYNNSVVVSSLSEKIPNPAFGKSFILALEGNLGVRTSGNSFLDDRLGYSYGLMQYVAAIENDSLYPGKCINIKDNKIIFVKLNNPDQNFGIDRIVSSVSAGETVSIRADQQTIKFTTAMNIFFSNQSGLTLNNGDIATFIKIDNYIEKTINNILYTFPETYQLISVIKSSSPL